MKSLNDSIKLAGTSSTNTNNPRTSAYASRRRELRRRRSSMGWDQSLFFRVALDPNDVEPGEWYGTPPEATCESSIAGSPVDGVSDSVSPTVIFNEIRMAKKHAAMRRAQAQMLTAL